VSEHEFRRGNRNRRNLYATPLEAGQIGVVGGTVEHAAAVSGWLADAATAWEAAGHPMPAPPTTNDMCRKHVAGTSSNRCLRPRGHSGDHSDEFEDWTLDRVREALGTPDGRAVSVHAAEVRAERDQLKARIDEAVRRWPFRLLLGVLMGSQEVADEYLAALQGDPASPQASPQDAPNAQASGEAPSTEDGWPWPN